MSHHSDKKSSRSDKAGREEGTKRVSSQPLRDSKEERKVAKNWVDKSKMEKEIGMTTDEVIGKPISKKIDDYLPKINPVTNQPDESTNFAEEINAQQASLQSLVTELQESDRALMETHAELNSALYKALTGNIDRQSWDYDFEKNMQKELKYEEQIVTKEKEIDDAIRELRRVYLKGAVNLALNKPSEEQIKKDNTVLRDYKVSMKRFVSCKETLLGCASFSVDDRSNPHFRNVTAIHECDIVRDKLIGKSSNVHEGTYLGTKVAIKKFSDSIPKERLQLLKDMECHKNIIALRGVLVTEGLGTTVLMQLAENGSLKEAFESNSYVFRFSRKIQWMRQLGQAMEWIHERSKPILHLRLHPSNLLLSSDFHIKIGDFGLGFVQPNVGHLVGNIKPFFTAPELLNSKNDDEIETNSTVAADIYSYGTCLWYILTEKKNKWKNMSFDQAKELLYSKDKNSGILPSSVDPALNKLIFDCCSKSPNERPQSFAVILDHPWKKYLNHAVAGGGNNVVNDIWEYALKDGAIARERGGNDVYFLDLATAYHHKFGMKQQSFAEIKRDENWRCMAIFLEVQHFHDRPEESIVKEENWQRFVHFFKPIEEDETSSTLGKFTSLCKNDWYFGRQDKKSARQILLAAKSHEKESKSLFKKKKPYVFIIRESSASASGDKETKGANVKANVNCKFSISYYDSSIKVDSFNKLEVHHTRLDSVNNVDQLISLINSQYNSKHGFEPCNSAQREFKGCFGSRQEQATGYEVADLTGKEKEDKVEYEEQVIISYIQ